MRISGEEAFRRRARLGDSTGTGSGVGEAGCSSSLGAGAGAPRMSAAERMMAKMGWSKGEGLGKSKQGMKAPLEAQKTSVRAAGVIVSGEEVARRAAERKAEAAPTKVVLLRNMVGRGEVDDALEDEVASECVSKYGPVRQVTFFEANESLNLPEGEAVRCFVLFEDCGGAMRAHADLNGRFFGGRKVVAEFYNEERFAQDDLF